MGTLAATFTYATGDTVTQLLDDATYGIVAWLAGSDRGWTKDVAKSGTNYATFSALNYNDPSIPADVKWCRLDFRTANRIFFGVSELGTFTGGDKIAYYSSTDSNYAQRSGFNAGGTATTSGTLYLYASPRWLLGFSQTSSGDGSATGNSFCGCVEISRDNTGDTYDRAEGNVPPFGWISGYRATQDTNNFSFVRTINALTGVSACQYTSIFTNFTMFGQTATSENLGLYYLISAIGLNQWGDASGNPTLYTSPIVVACINGAYDIRGRLFGLLLGTYNYGFLNSTTSIFVDPSTDTNCFWPVQYNNGGGENKTFRILPVNNEGTGLGCRFYIPEGDSV
jgi:hypothetical protein